MITVSAIRLGDRVLKAAVTDSLYSLMAITSGYEPEDLGSIPSMGV